jgi:hypothetical protein
MALGSETIASEDEIEVPLASNNNINIDDDVVSHESIQVSNILILDAIFNFLKFILKA